MKKKPGRLICTSILLTGLLSLPLRAQDTEVPWEIRSRDPKGGEVEVDAEGTISSETGVIIEYRDVLLTADKVRARQEAGEVEAEGNVTIQRSGRFWTGEKVIYNFRTGEMQAATFRTSDEPLFLSGAGLTLDRSNQVYTATNAFLTTDNVKEPGHRIRAKKIVVRGNKEIEAQHATLYFGRVPVFYFPWYRRSLGRHPHHFTIEPGYRSRFGPYLLTGFNWYGSERLDGTIHVDYYEQRGLGVGPDFAYNLDRIGKGTLQTYYIEDQQPGTDPFNKPIQEERYRLSWSHEALLRTNFTAKAVMRYQSDAWVVRDFFEDEYRQNVQPNSFVELHHWWENTSVNALVQPQLNPFFETVERLPDVRVTSLRQQLGVSPLYYEGENSFGYFRRQFADDVLPWYAAYRGDTFHQILLPQTYFGWLNFTPRVGGRMTYYSDADGPGAFTREETRGVFNTGAEVSFKASRIWRGASSRFWDVNELRHIIEPSVNYAFVPEPEPRPPQLPKFDYEVPSLRLLPIDYPDYNAIDSIDSQNVLRLGLRNKLQTKRILGIENLVNWALYTDWRLDPRSGQATFADFYSDLDLRPRSWLTLNSETRYDVNSGLWREANHTVYVQPTTTWSASLGHRFLRDDPLLGPDSGHNLITSSLYYRINENWGFRVAHRFEARDGTMEEQSYTIYRDLRSWTSALIFRLRENRFNQPDDFTVALALSLKAYPRYKLDRDRDRASYLMGQ